jgi:type IV pilus assembly protein PilO
MNFIAQFRNLDTRDVGRWPALFRGIAIGLIFALVAGGGTYAFVWRAKLPQLEQAQLQELNLRTTFESRQRLAANLMAYRDQLEEVERTFGAMLRQLPGETEVPGLLVDISQTGLSAGLEERLFQPMNEINREAYSELPIKMQVVGTYHELGAFVSGVVALPRIVTLHDVSLKPESQAPGTSAAAPRLVMDVTAKTYRYLEDEGAGK